MKRQDFPLLAQQPELVYLDSAATSQKPEIVIAALRDYYEQSNANVHRGLYPLAEKATAAYEAVRKQYAEFLGASPDEVIFTGGTTAALNQLAISWSVREDAPLTIGDVIIGSSAEHHSNLLPWQRLARNTGAVLELVDALPDGDFDLEAFAQLLQIHGTRVRIVSLSLVSNVLGGLLPYAEVIRLTREYAPEAFISFDAAQAIGHLPLTPGAWDIDALCFSGHKFYAETGCGVLWLAARQLEVLPAAILGGGMIQTVSKTDWKQARAAQGWEAGTPNISGVVSMGAALDYYQTLPRAELDSERQQLFQQLVTGLEEIPSIQIISAGATADWTPTLVSFVHEEIHAHDLAGYLGAHKVAIRAGHHCTEPLHKQLDLPASARVSLHSYNQASDIETFLRVLRAAIHYYQGGK